MFVSEEFSSPARNIDSGKVRGGFEPERCPSVSFQEIRQDEYPILSTIQSGNGVDITDVNSTLGDKLRIRVGAEALLPMDVWRDDEGKTRVGPKRFTREDFKNVCRKVFAAYQVASDLR